MSDDEAMKFTKFPYVIGLFFQPETAPPGQGFDLVLVPHKSWASVGYRAFLEENPCQNHGKIESLVGLVELKPILRYFQQNNKVLNVFCWKRKENAFHLLEKWWMLKQEENLWAISIEENGTSHEFFYGIGEISRSLNLFFSKNS